MRGLSKVIIGAAAAALAISALGAPVAAADTAGTLAVVNGYPNQRIDICIGSKEQASGVPYGSYLRKDVIGTGPKLLRFYKQNNARTCGGTKIAQKWVNISAGWDKTIVVTKVSPKVVVFDNASPLFLGEIPPRGAPWEVAPMAWRSAADFGTNFHYTAWSPNPELPIGPAVNDVWTKGQQFRAGSPDDTYWRVRATLPEQADTIAQRKANTKASRRYEWILVGTKKNNAKFVMVNRGVSQPSL